MHVMTDTIDFLQANDTTTRWAGHVTDSVPELGC